jgi:predicted transcriptional regulator
MNFIEISIKTEPEIIAYLASELPALIDGLKVIDVEAHPNVTDNKGPDIIAKVKIGRATRTLIIEVKSKGEPRFAKMAISQLKGIQKVFPNSYPVFAAPYISKSSREICKQEGVGYIDLVGNLYLRFSSVLIDVVSPESWPVERRKARKIFTPKGTRVIRDLLMNHKQPARITDLANRCNMSPGGVHWTVELLEDKAYVERDPEKRVVLTRPGELLDAWAEAWSIEKNHPRVFFSLEPTPESLMRSIANAALGTATDYAFTLLSGASKVAPYVRFNDVWVYIGEEEKGWGETLDLQPVDSGGNVVFLKPYDEGVMMSLQEVDGMKVVSNIQLYVDLYNYPGRGREQAEFLREKVLEF